MISRRKPRSGRPQELLREFSLNNSKGVDCTKAPTDSDTVARAVNLKVNVDGSMSLRDPIVYVPNTKCDSETRQYLLYDGAHRIVIDKNLSFRIVDADGTAKPVRVKCKTYTGDTVMYDTDIVSDLMLQTHVPTIVNLNTATIIGNCEVQLSYFASDIVDPTLYKDTESLPRYLKIAYSDTSKVWTVEVQAPEVNLISAAEGDIPLNPNMTLDAPTAVRDSYDCITPSIRGILAYAYSKTVDGNVVLDNVPALIQTTTASVETSMKLPTAEGATSITTTATKPLEESDVTVTTTLETSTALTAGQAPGMKFKVTIVVEVPDSSKYLVKCDYIMRQEYLVAKVPMHSTTIAKENVKSYYDVASNGKFTFKFTETFDQPSGLYDKYGVSEAEFNISVTRYEEGEIQWRVSDITETVGDSRFRIVTAFSDSTPAPVILKAFCNIPKELSTFYATWFVSKDGVTWNPLSTVSDIYGSRTDGISVKELRSDWKPRDDVKDDVPQDSDYYVVTYYPLTAVNERDVALSVVETPQEHYGTVLKFNNHRVDCVPVHDTFSPNEVTRSQFRFKIITAEATDTDVGGKSLYEAWATIGQMEYTPVFKDDFEFFDTEFGNAVFGKKIYHKKAIYSYGYEKFFNNIFVSDIDSFVTPLYNVIDLDAYEASVSTCVVPWRDYLVSATENAIYLHSKVESGFLTKTVNTSVGIPEEDSACCKPVLNGILFKSGPKIYQMYPNVYSGDDSTLNITEISRPVEEYLESYESFESDPFAFSTDTEYILMLPRAEDTLCLRYDYTSKLWAVCTYPVVFYNYYIHSLSNISLFGYTSTYSAEFTFDGTPVALYGDVLPDEVRAIAFEWDTGQKTDNISIQKQFVESKLIFSTEDTLEHFPMELTLHVDGDPHVTRLDLNSDAPFWKEGESIGVTNTAFRLSNAATSGVFRQLIVRYSGKGRSVRHILSGKPTSNFRLYETYVRYKTLNVKR